MTDIARRGMLLVLSSPSGAGKTTLAKRLLDLDNNLHLSVSVTTRPARSGEVDGEDYFFVDHDRFQVLRDSGDLLEWAKVFDHFYGTPGAEVEERLVRGEDVLFDIDWQGAQQLAQKMPEDVVRVFILPPSVAVLEERLRGRAQDSEIVVQRRMSEAVSQIGHWSEYDYVIVNSDVEKSVAGLAAIVNSERLRRTRCHGLAGFVEDLQRQAD